MTITTPATPEIIKAQTFLQPDADAEPLQTTLRVYSPPRHGYSAHLFAPRFIPLTLPSLVLDLPP